VDHFLSVEWRTFRPVRPPIPARAGEPVPRPSHQAPHRAYPRASGGTAAEDRIRARVGGLSPRERGNLATRRTIRPCAGPIPARAGEPVSRWPRRANKWAYPRASGGTPFDEVGHGRSGGLSPRERGNHGWTNGMRPGEGPIPARAGEPPPHRYGRWACRAYPRASGGTPNRLRGAQPNRGLSPRERGNRDAHLRGPAVVGPIPARAGEPRCSWRYRPCSGAYPRASGGTAIAQGLLSVDDGLSPRERGNLEGQGINEPLNGPIPARAGEPARGRCGNEALRAYPRASGGTPE
jgi:hypothetical protein